MTQQKKPRNPDHMRRVNVPSPQDEATLKQFEEFLEPAVYAHSAFYRSLNLHDRILNLPLMIAAILTMLWRQIPSVCEWMRTLNREGLLWMRPAKVSQPALSKRLPTFPAELFQPVFYRPLPHLRERRQARQRPLPEAASYALSHFQPMYAVDGLTLEALFRKLPVLKDTPADTLAGKICTVIDLATRLAEKIWYNAEVLTHDTNFLPEILSLAHVGSLWIFDRGFFDFTVFDNLIERGGHVITRLKSNTVFRVQSALRHTTEIGERVIPLGGANSSRSHLARPIELRFGSSWYSYLTSVLYPAILPANVVVELYRPCWRIEKALQIAKRLLNLAYLWAGSLNGILLQVWATGLFFALLIDLIDLGDAVAEELMLPFDRISLEMLFRGLYHFTLAHHRGKASDPIKYLSAPENQDLSMVKRLRKKQIPALALSTA